MGHVSFIPLSRRGFLQGLGGIAALSLLGLPFGPIAQASAAGGRTFLAATGRTLLAVDLAAGKAQSVPLQFIPHSFVPHPHEPGRVWAIERGHDEAAYAAGPAAAGPGRVSAAEIDIGSGEVLQYLAPPEGSHFFGHGFFAPDGSTLFISRVDMGTGDGLLTGYDAAGKIIADHAVAKGAVHEICLMADGTAMAVSSGIKPVPGSGNRFSGPRVDKGALLYIGLASGKVIEKQPVEDDAQMIGHCHRMEDGTLFVLARPRAQAKKGTPGKVFKGHVGAGPLREVSYTGSAGAGATGECLSIAVDERSKRALITNPENKRILVMDTHEGAFAGELDIYSRGVVFDPSVRRFYAGMTDLFEIDAATLAIQPWEPGLADGLGNRSLDSSHSLLL